MIEQKTRLVDKSNEMLEMYNSGMTLQQIGDHYEVSRQRIGEILLSNENYQPRDRRGMKRSKPLPAEKREEIVRLALEENLNSSEICQRVGVSIRVIAKVLQSGLTESQHKLWKQTILSSGHRKNINRNKFSDDDFVMALLLASKDMGEHFGIKKYADWRNKQTDEIKATLPGPALFSRRLGWRVYRTMAGLRTPEKQAGFGDPHYTEQEIMSTLDRWVQKYGRWITVVEALEESKLQAPELPTAATLRVRYGAWLDVRTAYYEWKAKQNDDDGFMLIS